MNNEKPSPICPDEADFPSTGPAPARLRFALNYAIQAPSSHNSQPWHFAIQDDFLLLCADRTRGLAVVDPYDRELTISCGAALLNLRVALSYFGCPYRISPFPYSADSDVLVRIDLCGDGYVDPILKGLFPQIPRRRTNRSKYLSAGVPDELQEKMFRAAEAEGVTLTCVEAEAKRKEIAEIVSEADRIQFSNPQFRRELASWIHSSRLKDGLPAYSYGAKSILDHATPIVSAVVRTFDVGNSVAASHQQLAEGSPLIVCLSTSQDDAQTWLSVGQALQRVLLVISEAGLDSSYLNQPIEVPTLRSRLQTITGGDLCPQILLRIGKGTPTLPSPRRPLDDVLW